MVFPDLSAPQSRPHKHNEDQLAVAPVADRLLALMLDFLIFSPVVSLFVAGFLRQTRTFFILSSTSQEAFVAALLLGTLVVFLVSVLQGTFFFFWQATPGQLFLQLRVVPYPRCPHPQMRLNLNQSYLRSFLWCIQFFVLALPFLEIVSHPLRRALHERSTDTLVVTLKKNYDEGPHPIETRFIASCLRMSSLLMLLFFSVGLFDTYQRLMAGQFRRDEASSVVQSCKEMKDSGLKGRARLDAAFTLYLLQELSPDCLGKEADLVLWENPIQAEDLGYLAKFAITEGDDQKKYYEKVCEDKDSNLCQLAHYINDDGDLKNLNLQEVPWWTAKFLKSEEDFFENNTEASLSKVEELQKVSVLSAALEKRFVRGMWTLKENTRQPASDQSPRARWWNEFSKRYELQ